MHMPTLINITPKYRKHRASGQAIVTLAGKDRYLGPHGTKASHLEYDRVVGEWLAAGRPSRATADATDVTVSEVCAAFWKHARQYYTKDGSPTGAADTFRPVLKLLKDIYGKTCAIEFGPLAVKALRARMIKDGNSRNYANGNLGRLKRIFRWAASEQLIPASVPQAIDTVDGLRKGHSEARETEPILPVDDWVVDATLPHLPAVVADMARLQRFTGARPGEVCDIRPCDIDRTGDVWLYRPESHKTQHRGRSRIIAIGPRAQEILRPYLLREPTAFCFSPADSERKRSAARREARETPMTPSQEARKASSRPLRARRLQYTKDSYRRAVARAIELANEARQLADTESLPHWHPNQLRHSMGTATRQRFGLEAAQVVLGHSKADVTQVYAERDQRLAVEVARQVG